MLGRLGIAGLLLLLAAALLPQVALNTGVIERLIAGDSKKVTVHWDAAWMPWPGRVHVRGLVVEERRETTTWMLHVGRLSTHVALTALLDRELRLSRAKVHEVSFFLRGDADAAGELALALPLLSAPPGHPRVLAATPPRQASRELGEEERGPWTFQVEALESDSVRELWFGPYRVLLESGRLKLEGRFQPGRHLRLHRLQLTGLEGEAWRGREFPGARIDQGEVDLRINAKRRDGGGLDVHGGLHGSASLRVVLHDLGYLLRFADPGVLPATALTGGAGEAHVEVHIGEGGLLPGSTLSARGERLKWAMPPGALSGAYELQASVQRDPEGAARTELLLGIDDARLVNQEGQTLGTAPRLEVRGEALQGERLGQSPITQALSVRLAEPAQLSLPALNPWLGGFLDLQSGEARLRLDLAWGTPLLAKPPRDPDEKVVPLELRVERLVGTLGGTPVRGRLRARLHASGGGPGADSGLSLGDLRIAVDGLELGSLEAPRVRDWSGTLTLGELVMHASPPRLRTQLTGTLESAEPVVHLLVDGGRMPPVLRDLLAVDDVTLSAQVSATPHVVRLRKLRLDGDGLWVKGDLTARAHGRPQARLLARVAFLPVGIEVRSGKLDLHLFRPYSWFESTQEGSPGAPPRAGRRAPRKR